MSDPAIPAANGDGPMQTTPIVYVDLETGGLRNDDDPWEIAARKVMGNVSITVVWHINDFNTAAADPMALRMAGFYERHPAYVTDPALIEFPGGEDGNYRVADAADVAREFREFSHGAILVCCNAGFDPAVLTRWMDYHCYAATWHYRPICATTYAAGYIDAVRATKGLPPMPWPWDNRSIGAALGIDRDGFGVAHTGLADLLYAEALVSAVWRGVMPHLDGEPSRNAPTRTEHQ